MIGIYLITKNITIICGKYHAKKSKNILYFKRFLSIFVATLTYKSTTLFNKREMSTTIHQTKPLLKFPVENAKDYLLEFRTNPTTNRISDLVLKYQLPNHDGYSRNMKHTLQHMRKKLTNCKQLTKIIEERIHVGQFYTYYREIFRIKS